MSEQNLTPSGQGTTAFTADEFASVTKYLVGHSVRLYPSIHIPQVAGPARAQEKPELMVQNIMESCAFKSFASFVIGGGLGAFMGLFSSSIAPHHTTHQVLPTSQLR